MPSESPPTIRTPDQRLRVFVSSTLHELAAERQSARQAIQQIRLTPVMFELGARPHPPRDLYRAYLAQSDVFVGIYAARYGWVAPDMEVSGLEDEYVLSRGMPKLIYLKRVEEREPRLDALVETITRDGDASYRPFTESKELEDLLGDDLALLLTERFGARPAEEAAAPAPVASGPPAWTPPEELGEVVGRDGFVERLASALDSAPLVTLTGPGGTGKTTLAVRAARQISFPDGVFYVPLAAVRAAADVLPTLRSVLEIPLARGGEDARQLVTNFLRPRRALLVLDNFEHVMEASRDVAALLAACRSLRVLVTSRVPLRIRGEREVQVPPLEWEGPGPGLPPALRLFEARAQDARPSFVVDDQNRAAVQSICRRLDGLPLAIELAAARVRILTPQAMLPRLDRCLQLLVGGARDLPERQQTLRGALQWSWDLLPSSEQVALRRWGVFVGSFSFEAAEAVLGADAEVDTLDVLEALVDKNLLVRTEALGESRFHTLETVRAFAREQLELAGEEVPSTRRMVGWATAIADRIAHQATRAGKFHAYERLAHEEPQLRAAFEACARGIADPDDGWRIRYAYGMALHNQLRFRESLDLHDRMDRVSPCRDPVVALRCVGLKGCSLASAGDVAAAIPLLEGIGDRLRAAGAGAIAGYCDVAFAMARMQQGDFEPVFRLDGVLAEFRASGEVQGEGWARSMQAFVLLAMKDFDRVDAASRESLAWAERSGDDETISMMSAMRATVLGHRGDLDGARELAAKGAAHARARSAHWGRTYALGVLASVTFAQGDVEAACAILEEALADLRYSGVNPSAEIFAGALAGIHVGRGDPDRAARLLRIVPDGYEDERSMASLGLDPLGSLLGSLKSARAHLGTGGRAAADRDAAYEDAIQAALGVAAALERAPAHADPRPGT